ncbi:hypothetical protein EVAR_38739_1 [Eumeta japonica]|uniref:Uncharacterized protein n=1 Tax=Eumeta variegata TaxID=151549 RepID=A0A4C1YPU4_EUMVA|nr:hypothetical protein EVAR_38739_1 [Eumeta japonica]
MLWSTWLQDEKGSAPSVRYHTLTEYRIEVIFPAPSFSLVSKSSGETSPSTIPLSSPPDILFLPKRSAAALTTLLDFRVSMDGGFLITPPSRSDTLLQTIYFRLRDLDLKTSTLARCALDDVIKAEPTSPMR